MKSILEKKLDQEINGLYLQRPKPSANAGIEFADATRSASTIYFGFARHALLTALQIAGVNAGDKVLLPGFICRDLLGPIQSIGAVPIFYEVDSKFSPALDTKEWPDAKVVVAVNFFGFEQDLRPFLAFAKRTGALLIEDNAHGLFSKDQIGNFLGSRGDMGLFSFRKSAPMATGAAIVVNTHEKISTQAPEQKFVSDSMVSTLRNAAKTVLASLFPVIGNWPIAAGLFLKGKLVKSKSKKVNIDTNLIWETQMPSPKWAASTLPKILLSFPIEEEKLRRRRLYKLVEERLILLGAESIFLTLPENTVPYMYCFRISYENRLKVENSISDVGLRLIQWPDLPEAIRETCPEHYKNVFAVPLMW